MPEQGEITQPKYDPQPLKELLEAGKLTPDRKKIVAELMDQPWFQGTEPKLQLELAMLPQEGKENHDGFLRDLASRREVIGGAKVLKMQSLNRGNFALIPVFEVDANGTQYTYEYVSWRYGPQSGAKGIVFVRPPIPGASPTHFITLVGEKFAPGKKVNDTVGGFIDLGVEGVQTLMDRIHREVSEELGVEDIKVDEVVDLGQIYTDPGMTNNNPNIFAAFIGTEQYDKIPLQPVNPDIYELKSGALVLPMQQLKQFILENTDAYFQASMLKAIAQDAIPYEWLGRATPQKPAL